MSTLEYCLVSCAVPVIFIGVAIGILRIVIACNP
jgi:hypothetical protein